MKQVKGEPIRKVNQEPIRQRLLPRRPRITPILTLTVLLIIPDSLGITRRSDLDMATATAGAPDITGDSGGDSGKGSFFVPQDRRNINAASLFSEEAAF